MPHRRELLELVTDLGKRVEKLETMEQLAAGAAADIERGMAAMNKGVVKLKTIATGLNALGDEVA